MLEADNSKIALQTDGRFQRSERSKTAIVTALYELVGEGATEPTADEVAERAQIASRTVYRHFKDMDTLYGAMDRLLVERFNSAITASIPQCNVQERVDAFVLRRAKLYEGIGPYKRAVNLKRARSKFLKELHGVNVRRLNDDLHRWFPELSELEAAAVHAVELVTTFESWDALRTDQRLGVKRATDALRTAISSLLGLYAGSHWGVFQHTLRRVSQIDSRVDVR